VLKVEDRVSEGCLCELFSHDSLKALKDTRE
jgi:hypothetical protein